MSALRMTVILSIAIVAGPGARKLFGQKGTPPPAAGSANTNPVATPVRTVNLGSLADPEAVRREVEQAAKEAKVERQKRIQKDTDKLLKLSVELQAEMESLSTGQVTQATIHKTEQIEKLAHDVGQRTRKP